MKRIPAVVLTLLLAILLLAVYGEKANAAGVFVHSGIFYSEADFNRAKQQLALKAQPWKLAWDRTLATKWADPQYTPHPVTAPMRNANPAQRVGDAEMFDDAFAALAQAIIWKVSSDPVQANQARLKAEEILDAWASTVNREVSGGEPQLLAGLCGYKFAAAADILRSDDTWVRQGRFAAVQSMLKNYFLPPCQTFLATHFKDSNGMAYPYYYRGNQDLAAIITIMATGILTDDADMYNEAVTDVKSGDYNGRISYYLFPTDDVNLAQCEESGRDQGHVQLGLGLLSYMAQASFVQHQANPRIEDLFDYDNRLILKGTEYTAKYNEGQDVSFTPLYTADNNTYGKKARVESEVSTKFRGEIRPIYDLVWNHYHSVKGVPGENPQQPAYYTQEMLKMALPGRENTDFLPFSLLMFTSVRDDTVLSTKYCISIVPRSSNPEYQYFTAADHGVAPLTANKALKNYIQDITAAETFYAEYTGNGTFALRLNSSNRYVTAARADEPLQVQDTKIVGDQNKFYIEDVGNGYVAIKSAGTGKYLAVEPGTRQLFTDEATVGKGHREDTFRIITLAQ